MLLSALSFLVVAQSSSEVPEGLMNNPVYIFTFNIYLCVRCLHLAPIFNNSERNSIFPSGGFVVVITV